MTTSLLAVVATSAPVAAQPVALAERPGHVTEGTVVIDAPPADVYQLVTDYAAWPRVLSDVSSVKVERGQTSDARVAFHSRSIGYDVTLQFDNVPDREINFVGIKGPPGGRAHGKYLLVPTADGQHTQVTADLYLDVVGMPGWFVSDAYVRGKRRAKLERDLADVQRYFAERAPNRPSASAARATPAANATSDHDA